MSYLVVGMKIGEKAVLTDRRAVGRWVEITLLHAAASEAVVYVSQSPEMDVRSATGQPVDRAHRLAVSERMVIRTADGEVIGNVWPTLARGKWARLALEAPRFLALTRKFSPPPVSPSEADAVPIRRTADRWKHTA